MDLAELKDYRKWVGKNAALVLEEVLKNGGWVEVIIDNPESGLFGRSSNIGDEAVSVDIHARVVVTEEYIGPYNYSETIDVGFAAHDLRDIQPHRTTKGFYLDPKALTLGE